jgi:polar amino acid transport system substrate-binding protein
MNAGSSFRAALGRVALAFLLLASASGGAKELVFDTQDFAPFTFLEDGVVAGPAMEVIRAACRGMGQPCRINLLPWA